MEAQRLLSGFCSPSPIPNARTQYFVRFPSPSLSPSSSSSSSTASFAQSHRWVSFKARPLSTKLIQCRNTADAERAEVVVSSDKQDLTSGIRRKKLAGFVSGGGSNFRSIHEACLNGLILGDVSFWSQVNKVVEAPTMQEKRASQLWCFRKLNLSLTEYLRLTLLLPLGDYGMKVHKAVIASGARYTGPTIHFVDEHYDTGRILAQRVVPVLAKDTGEELAARVLQEEHSLYVEVITAVCEERIVWREDGVPIIRSKENPNEYG